ncbi:uncharacterized protein LOC119660349 isoform X1 [Hermetia illucens]|uniref:uncharacterized protein LOC119660349 isoform X1 n=1 Tax=Hermetia illucens TaxID=343691 RepID=UPI0018CBFCC5|nr:uncharacterized protein LOC119660349 isoform X1 [Hermetia illucens]XP_037924772.1 uncharacterized protein LOC119660349 isoform X1 [Hermetia illucens]
MIVMLSVRTSSVHERQAETIHPKNRLTARLGSFIVQRKNKTGFANHTTPAQTNPISSKLSNSPNCGSQIKRRSTKLKAFVRQSKEKFGENLQSLTTFKRQTSVDTKNLDFSATTTTPKKTTIKPKPSFILGELNNFRKPPTVQVPVATILNDLSPVPGAAKVKNKTVVSPMNPKGLQSDTPDVKAMRYYRLWIYTCNAVLLMAVIVFCGVAGKVLIADYRRLLVTGLNLGQPNFIYAYLALLMQSGFLQLIGCLGALRLSEKLLNAYWLILLVLLIGDALLGIFWMFKFDRIIHDLQPILRYRLATEYGSSNEFSDLWDRLQTEGRCCGVIGPQDYSTMATNRSYPASCCSSSDLSEQISVSRRPLASPVVFRNDELSAQQKNNLTDIADTTWSHVVSESRESKVTTPSCKAVFPQGCTDRMVTWLRNTADILFVLGYCVIAFLKLCFLGILRYEIREMIQKIKLLQNEMSSAILEPEIEQQQLTQVTNTSINGGLHTEPKVGNRDRERSRMSSGESERESLLIHENPQPPRYLKNKHLYGCMETGAPGGESDTNSNCALIVEDASAVAAAKSINGNNNYELTEFDTKAPTYRHMNAPTVTKI